MPTCCCLGLFSRSDIASDHLACISTRFQMSCVRFFFYFSFFIDFGFDVQYTKLATGQFLSFIKYLGSVLLCHNSVVALL